ncbi:hypothetical protein NUW54_g5264 [Trametes sanguinea]|uniref:Uncharacterized protein n=1 Tax=Trametes sanguinea TaxID=158606 RepID=A0ACC1PVJ9_9APHY|nr:hypothetical protein NUW54_g5264 [Trametes sanguinea]
MSSNSPHGLPEAATVDDVVDLVHLLVRRCSDCLPGSRISFSLSLPLASIDRLHVSVCAPMLCIPYYYRPAPPSPPRARPRRLRPDYLRSPSPPSLRLPYVCAV